MSQALPQKPRRVMLWTSHRCVSTAFTCSMGQIPGIEMWCEPYFYAKNAMQNLKLSEGEELPTTYTGNEVVFEKAAKCIGKVLSRRFKPKWLSYNHIRNLLEDSTAEYVFVKDIGLAMPSNHLREFIPRDYRHSFLIRHPLLMFSSLHKTHFNHLKSTNLLHADETDIETFDLRNHLEMEDPSDFFRSLYDLWKHVRGNIDPDTIIIDSSDLLGSPSMMLFKYCRAMGLPFNPNMLEWKSSFEDIQSWKWSCEVNPNNIYIQNLLTSTRLEAPRQIPSRDVLTPDVIELAEEALPFYEEMYENRLH